jgi:hypothetical protein
MQRVVNKVCAELLARGLVDEAIEFHAEYPCIDIMTRAEARLLVDAAVQAIAEAARQADNIFEYAIDRKSDERSTRQADATYQGEQAAKKEAARVEHKRKNEEAALAGVREKAWKKHKDFSEAYRLEQVRKAVEEHLEKWKRKSRQKK